MKSPIHNPPPKTEESTILAVHPGALGDLVLFGHLLSCLQGRVTIVAGGQKGQLLVGARPGGAAAGLAARAIDFDLMPMHELFTDAPLDRCTLPGLLGRHDRLISCFPAGNPRARQRLSAMCQAQDAVFLSVRPEQEFSGHLLDLWMVATGDPPSARLRVASSTRRDGLDVAPGAAGMGAAEGPISPQAPAAWGFAKPVAWEIPLPWRQEAAAMLAALGVDTSRPYVMIHPGAGAPEKCWPLERFVELGRACEAAVLVVGEVEADRWPAERIDALRREFPVLTCPPLVVLAGVLAGARAFAGNDSGPAHLAAALGVPTVALFGPSRSQHFAPRGPSVNVLVAQPLDRIGVAEVVAALAEISKQPRGCAGAKRRKRRRAGDS